MFPIPTNIMETIRESLMPVFCFTISQALFVNSNDFVSLGFLLATQVLIFLPICRTWLSVSISKLDFDD
jgi:hypothetical protein